MKEVLGLHSGFSSSLDHTYMAMLRCVLTLL